MEYLSSDGPMHLLKIDSIFLRKNISHGPDFFLLRGKGWQLAATHYHAFLLVRGGKNYTLTTDQLKPNDKIWVDRHAFEKDGSLTLRITA